MTIFRITAENPGGRSVSLAETSISDRDLNSFWAEPEDVFVRLVTQVGTTLRFNAGQKCLPTAHLHIVYNPSELPSLPTTGHFSSLIIPMAKVLSDPHWKFIVLGAWIACRADANATLAAFRKRRLPLP